MTTSAKPPKVRCWMIVRERLNVAIRFSPEDAGVTARIYEGRVIPGYFIPDEPKTKRKKK